MAESKTKNVRLSGLVMIVLRVLLLSAGMVSLIPNLNPARLSESISKNASLFTSAISYSTIGENFVRALTHGWITQPVLTTTYVGALVTAIGVVALLAAACASIGKLKLQRLSALLGVGGSLAGLVGAAILRYAYGSFTSVADVERIKPMLPAGITVFMGLFIVILLLSAVVWATLPKPTKDDVYSMDPKYRLFLMMLPFIVLIFLFSYLPLWGWRYAFFDYRAGKELTLESFVGFKWLNYLFGNPATRADILRVLKNTFAISGIGILMSWLPMAFAIFLAEIRSNKSRRVIQTLTTIPNFIGWILVYSVAFAIFSTEGFMNWMLTSLGIIKQGTNWLMSGDHIWLKMWAWSTWKGLGWSAIIYIASITGIDQQLYEAAIVDGAGRFQKMWYITVPSLMSTFFVLLLLSIANILTNGMEQYLAFYNPANRETIQVLDLYVYHLGIFSSASSNIPLATLIGMLKSIISVVLLFTANKVSAFIRGESIV